MSNCPHCKMTVGGNFRKCPLCQSPLLGEPTEKYWPTMEKLKTQSFVYKLIIFLIIVSIIMCLALDYLLLPSQRIRWSVPITVSGIACLLLFMMFYRNHRSVSKILFISMVVFSILSVWTEYYVGYHQLKISTDFIVPILIMGVLIANFVFSFMKNRFLQNTMLYILFNIIVGITPYVAFYLFDGKAPLAWTICLLVSIITLVGIVIFRGRELLIEIQKRLHI